MAVKGAVDTWKKKKAFQLIAPNAFNEIVIGETVAEKPDSLIGRIVNMNMGSLTRDIKRRHITLLMQVKKVEGLKAFTELKGFEVNPGYLRRIVRRRVSKIESNQFIQSKDGLKGKIKAVAVTMKKAHKNQETTIRKLMEEEISLTAKQNNFDDLVGELLFGGVSMRLFGKAKKVLPIKRVEITKAMQLKERTVSQAG